MQKKIARKIASITAVSLASGLITVPAGANADLTPNLQIMQKTEIISDEALDQSYQYDYQSDGNDQKFTQVETSWDNAFVAKKLVVGDWKNYDGDVVVSILKDDGMEYQLQTTENAQVELSDYGEISSIKLQPAGEIANSDASMSGMVIDGDIDMSQASDTVELKGTIRESEDGENFTSKVDETVSATVLKTSYKIETPVWKTEQDKLSYGQTAKVTLDGLAGTGTAELSSYECQLIIPKGTEIEQIDLPEFEHATSTLFVDGKEYTEGIITSDSKVLLQICLEKDNNSLIEDDNSQDEDNNSPAYDFKQTKSLSLLLKNIQQDAKSEDVLIQAYVKAVYGDDQEVKTEASQKIQLICEYQMESPKVSSSATIIPGQDDVQLTFNNMNATATTSVTGYMVDFYIPSDLTVETIRVPEFVDSEGNSVERLITINGQHPSILNKTIFLYDKIGSFQMVVYTKDGTFSQSRDMVITASNQTYVDASGQSGNSMQLFQSQFGDVTKGLSLSTPTLPEGYDMSHLVSSAASNVSDIYKDALASSGVSSVKDSINTQWIFQKAASGPDSYSIKSYSELSKMNSGGQEAQKTQKDLFDEATEANQDTYNNLNTDLTQKTQKELLKIVDTDSSVLFAGSDKQAAKNQLKQIKQATNASGKITRKVNAITDAASDSWNRLKNSVTAKSEDEIKDALQSNVEANKKDKWGFRGKKSITGFIN